MKRMTADAAIRGLLLLASLLLPLSGLDAQSIWSERSENGAITLEAIRPSFDGDAQGTLVGSFFAGARLPVTESLTFVGEIPVARGSFESSSGDDSGFSLGNPYVGLETGGVDSRVFVEVGVRLPLMPEPDDAGAGAAVLTGLFADIDRMEAYFNDVLTISGMVNHYYVRPNGVVTRLRGGPSIWFPTGDTGADTEFNVSYGGLVGYQPGTLGFGGAFTGRWTVSSDADFSDASLHRAALRGWGDFDGVKPHIEVQIPIDEDLSEVVDYALGIAIAIPTS